MGSEAVLEVGGTYRDRNGIDWTIRCFMYDAGNYFVEHENGNYVALRRAGTKKERWTKRKTFLASLAASRTTERTEK